MMGTWILYRQTTSVANVECDNGSGQVATMTATYARLSLVRPVHFHLLYICHVIAMSMSLTNESGDDKT